MNANSVMISGRLAQDVKFKITPNGTPIADLRVASNSKRIKGEDGKSTIAPVFVPVRVIGRQAESASQYLVKGQAVEITGRLEVENWKDADAKPHSRMYVLANTVQFGAKPAAKPVTA